jgi:hypothetical protein
MPVCEQLVEVLGCGRGTSQGVYLHMKRDAEKENRLSSMPSSEFDPNSVFEWLNLVLGLYCADTAIGNGSIEIRTDFDVKF